MGKSSSSSIIGGGIFGLGPDEPDTPDIPDYRGAAEATGESAREALTQQTWANRANQYTPWGQSTWNPFNATDPATGQRVTRWSQNVKLTPEMQQALDAQQDIQRQRSDIGAGLIGRAGEEFSDKMDWGEFGDLQELGFDPSEYTSGLGDIDPNQFRQQASDAMYQQATSRLDPRFEQQSEALEVKLRNQGLRAGDQAYDAAMGNFERGKTDAYSQAQNQAMLAGRGEAAQMFGQQTGLEAQRFGQFQGLEGQRLGQATTMADYANKLRQSGMAEEMQKRGFSLNEINALMSGQQVQMPQMPGFERAGVSRPTEYLGAAGMQGQANLDLGSLEQAQYQSQIEGITSLLSSAASAFGGGMMCDRRLKKDIIRIGEYLGYPLYVFKYLWGVMAVGVMSDEVNSEAVTQTSEGYDMVDYDKLKPINWGSHKCQQI